jgi:hypothetical protein
LPGHFLFHFVMAGLVPAIHVFTALMICEGVDARHSMSGLPDIDSLNAQVG